jgi:hypothetical protein
MRVSAGRAHADTDELHPIWRILLPAENVGRTTGPESLRASTCELSDRGSWRPKLMAAMETVAAKGALLVTADRSFPQALLGLVSHSRWKRRRSPALREVRALLHESGFEVLTEYAVWPSRGMPRVALRASSFRAFNWIQRSGVLGGGGDRVGARALARSALFTPVAYFLAPRAALIARRRDSRDPNE